MSASRNSAVSPLRIKSNSVDDFSSPMLTSSELLESLSRGINSTTTSNSTPTHGVLVPSKKRTNSNFAFTMLLCNHIYHVCYRRDTPRGERVYWRCQLRGQCKARLITDTQGRIVQFTNPDHTHPSTTSTFESCAARRRQRAQTATKVDEPKWNGSRDSEGRSEDRDLDHAVREIYEKIAVGQQAENVPQRPTTNRFDRSATFDDSVTSGTGTASTATSVVDSSSVQFANGSFGGIDQLLIQQNSEGYGSSERSADEEDEANDHESGHKFVTNEPPICEEEEENEVVDDEDANSSSADLTSTPTSEINLEEVWNQISLLQTFNLAAAVVHSSTPCRKVGESGDKRRQPTETDRPELTQDSTNVKIDEFQSNGVSENADVESPISLQLARRSGWSVSLQPTNNTRQQLRKTFRFQDFGEAFGFMSRCALRAAQLRSFPEWTNSDSLVHVRLPRDQRMSVGQLEVELATFMDRVYSERNEVA